MAKVITSAGLNEFIESGKHETIKADAKPKQAEAPALDVKIEQPVADLKLAEQKKDEPQDDIYAEEDQETKEEITKAKRFDALMRKKHRAMKEAQEAAAENDRLAESQFNRARLAEQKLAEVEAQLKEFQAKSQPAKPELVEPNETDPKFFDEKGQFKWREFTKAQAKYETELAVAEYAAKQEEARKMMELAEAEGMARARVAEAEKKHPDYREVIEKADVQTHQQVLNYLTTSEHIGEIGYYMATHPEFVERINKLHPLKAIAEVGKLELTFEKPAEAPKPPAVQSQAVSGAPPPIVPLEVSRSVDVQTDPAKMNFQQLRAYERSRNKKR